MIGVIICGGLLYLFLQQSPNDGTTNNQKDSATKIQQAELSKQGLANEDGYLVIKEWNVRFKLPESIRDVVVTEQTDDFIGLTTKQVEGIEGCDGVALIAIERGQKGQSIGSTKVDTLLESENKPLIKIDKYYYLNTGPVDSCVESKSQSDEELVGKTKGILHLAFKTLESAN